MKKVILFVFLAILGIISCHAQDNLIKQKMIRGLPDSLRKKADTSWVSNNFYRIGTGGLATQSWVLGKGYTTLPAVRTMLKFDELIQAYDINIIGTAEGTETWVSEQGYLPKADTNKLHYRKFDALMDSISVLRSLIEIGGGGGGGEYIDSSKFATVYNLDTVKGNLYVNLGQKAGLNHTHSQYLGWTDTSAALAYTKLLLNYKLNAGDSSAIRTYSNYLYQPKGTYLGWADTSQFLSYIKALINEKLNQTDTVYLKAGKFSAIEDSLANLRTAIANAGGGGESVYYTTVNESFTGAGGGAYYDITNMSANLSANSFYEINLLIKGYGSQGDGFVWSFSGSTLQKSAVSSWFDYSEGMGGVIGNDNIGQIVGSTDAYLSCCARATVLTGNNGITMKVNLEKNTSQGVQFTVLKGAIMRVKKIY